MDKKQDIVPVKLQDGKRHSYQQPKSSPQKLVARLKCEESELFIYEEIQDHTLKLLLSELYKIEDC